MECHVLHTVKGWRVESVTKGADTISPDLKPANIILGFEDTKDCCYSLVKIEKTILPLDNSSMSVSVELVCSAARSAFHGSDNSDVQLMY